MASRASRALRFRALQPLSSALFHCQVLASPIAYQHRPDDWVSFSFGQLRALSTSISKLPKIADPDLLHAVQRLMAVNWSEISEETKDAVSAALSKRTEDKAGQEKLANAWRAAKAVEQFSGTLVNIRMELDDLTGFSGERVRPLPPLLMEAVKSALSRYNAYLAAFEEDDIFLKKKVEVELGSLLIHIRQRCSGLGPEWGNISLLGTSGISGSFIEYRAQ